MAALNLNLLVKVFEGFTPAVPSLASPQPKAASPQPKAASPPRPSPHLTSLHTHKGAKVVGGRGKGVGGRRSWVSGRNIITSIATSCLYIKIIRQQHQLFFIKRLSCNLPNFFLNYY